MFAVNAANFGTFYAVLSLGLAAFVALASRATDGERGFTEWALGSVCLALAFPLNLLQEQLPLGFTIGVSNFLFMLGWCFLYYAVRTFFGRHHPHGLRCKWPWLLALAHGAFMAFLAVGLESVPARLFVFNTVAALALAAAAWEVKPPASGSLRTAALLTRWIFAAIAFLHALRVLWFALAGTPDAVISPVPIQILVSVAHCLLQIALTFSFLLMQNFRLTDELRQQADFDVLTGLLNRRGLDRSARRALARAQTDGRGMALLMLDIDHFKQINDTHGHAIGDKVLCWLSDTLPELLRPSDLLGRYGGEEFVVLLPDTDLATAHKIAERIRAGIEAQTPDFDGRTICLTLSLGIALAKDGDYDLARCLAQADTGLYLAKNSGRNQARYLPPGESLGALQFT